MTDFTDQAVSPDEVQKAVTDILTEEISPYSLIVWNDEVNTFDWVIESLMEVCRHTTEQAEQSAIIIHYKGKHAVKIGELNMLKPMCEALLDRGISATIEETVNA